MFRVLFLSALILASVGLYAENELQTNFQDSYRQQNLFDNILATIGAGGGPTIRGTFINNQLFPSIGGEGYAIINHSIMIGGGGYGIPLYYHFNRNTNDMSGIGWGGLILGYIFMPEILIHPYVKTLIGAGGVGYISNTTSMDGGVFFVLEGEVGVEINIIKWMRICPYVGYHYIVGGIDVLGLKDVNLSGWHFGVTAKFGVF